MAWYWIVIICLAVFVAGFVAALFWVRSCNLSKQRHTPEPPHYSGPAAFTQMNPYLTKGHD